MSEIANECYTVVMGRLDHLNGPASYQFPTPEAARRFVDAHQRRDPQRSIAVMPPERKD